MEDTSNKKSKSKRVGRPSKHEPTLADRARVSRMASMGIPQYQIALVYDITEKTLRKKYKEELSKGAVEANLRVTETLFQMATSGANAAASIFWAKTRCGFRSSGPEVEEVKRAGDKAAGVAAQEPAYMNEPAPEGSVQVMDCEGKRIA